MTKTFVLNIENLNSTEDTAKIEDHFMGRPGVEDIEFEMDLKIVTIHYNESIGSPNKLLQAFTKLGYPVR